MCELIALQIYDYYYNYNLVTNFIKTFTKYKMPIIIKCFYWLEIQFRRT